jgi:hypothetical protein
MDASAFRIMTALNGKYDKNKNFSHFFLDLKNFFETKKLFSGDELLYIKLSQTAIHFNPVADISPTKTRKTGRNGCE